MEHHINIEETILEDVYKLQFLDPKCCIYKVHEGLRKVKPEAYEPMLVSIGPYHHRNPKVEAMKEHKLWYLHSLLKNRKEGEEKYISELEKLEDRARNCYANPIDLESKEFVQMMLLDGFFVIEFLRKRFFANWMNYQICHDMMLLENQLPYFVLSRLYDMTKDPEEKPFMEMVMLVFTKILPKPPPISTFELQNNRNIDASKIKHLLDLIHIIFRPQSKDLAKNEKHFLFPSELENGTKSSHIFDQMHSVVELQEAGVKFKKVGKVQRTTDADDANNISLFNVDFNNGLMEVPCFIIQDSIETFFRNLIAYEQHSLDNNPKYFTDNAIFMDNLINSEKDVELLRLKGIIVNWLGEDKEVSDLFNRLGKGLVFDSETFYYSEVCNKVNEHCGKTWNHMMAKLRRNYFNTPWASVSTIAAGVLLLLTLLQIIEAFKHK